ncbi:ribosome biogenesis GTPase Lsg1 [Cordyceps fumosorosea ARSEF 2679]|uniref:Ribosome biogenesis GTPase Lsg1 n=1 Tax=Cordyceps fumosorosea (strain ARSEF 2679) TaxID=1081104 RepID=A0A168DDS5_CORFA|nr:ribosome biogenesis GTPase Lsg1 [Cordyceps fumosorosea ARSEF 2679]OAA72485.1 ribosome biogenesis GTPase Lsg1 [Cordyceps fumosorosea ARSEF 2679]
MVLAKSKQSVGLGNALMNDRFGKGKGVDRKKGAAVARTHHATGEQYLVNEKQDAAWVKMRSVTEQSAMDEFLSTAELAGTDFTAEKVNNVKIIHTDQKNPYLLSATEERAVLGKHKKHRDRLTVPRRPKWDASTTPQQLDLQERNSFLDWRRGLAELQENNDLLMTPFERNLEVWRQLWRVIERSDLIVQIVDARNPLLFRSEDLEHYVKDVDPKKENLLLINKADMMTHKQRHAWAKHLKKAGIAFRFFSAHLAKEMNEARDREEEEEDSEEDTAPRKAAGEPSAAAAAAESSVEESSEEESVEERREDGGVSVETDDTEILTVDELEELFLQHKPTEAGSDRKLQVGLVGYPNVGKSSTINALIGATKVSVSSTPGKTKHFQTIHLSDRVVLCDCPGLVFPNFASTKADLVCNGVLPIDQMREYTGPVGLVTQRIPHRFLEAVYGITIKIRPIEEGGTGVPTGEELLRAYASARGLKTSGLGQPDQSRAARYVLKDYVNGKLLFVSPPPGIDDATAFNRELYDELHLPEKRRAALAAAAAAAVDNLSLADDVSIADAATSTAGGTSDMASLAPVAGPKTQQLDKGFFGPRAAGGHVTQPFNYKYTEQGARESGKALTGRKARTAYALENGLDPKELAKAGSKKHFKGGMSNGKGKKQHRGLNLDDD